GQALKFTNEGKIAHTATSSQGAFDTGLLKGGESATVTFDTPGTYAYFCQPHPWMQATVVVQGEARAASTQAQLVRIPEEDESPPSIGALRAGAFVVTILAVVFAIGFASRRRAAG